MSRRLGAVAAVGALTLIVVALATGLARPPVSLPTFSPAALATAAPGTSLRVTTIPALLTALADNSVTEIVVANGTYRVSPASRQAPNSLWIDSRFAGRTTPVVVRAETRGGVTFDGGGSTAFGGLTFVDGAHDQTWDGFVFANGSPVQTGVIVFGGYAGLAAPHHITLRSITLLPSITGTNDRNDHGIYFSYAVGGPHDLLIEDFTVDASGPQSAVDRAPLLPLRRNQSERLEHDHPATHRGRDVHGDLDLGLDAPRDHDRRGEHRPCDLRRGPVRAARAGDHAVEHGLGRVWRVRFLQLARRRPTRPGDRRLLVPLSRRHPSGPRLPRRMVPRRTAFDFGADWSPVGRGRPGAACGGWRRSTPAS